VLLGEVAVIIEAWSRQAIADSISDFERTPMGRVASSTLSFQKSLADQLGPASVFVPALWPAQLAYQARQAAELTEEDLEVLRSVRKLMRESGISIPSMQDLAQASSLGRGGTRDTSEVRSLLSKNLRAVQAQGPSARVLVNRLVRLLQDRVKERLRVSAETALASSLKTRLPPSAPAPGRGATGEPQTRQDRASRRQGSVYVQRAPRDGVDGRDAGVAGK
jgi:hypothetical protein